MTQTKTRRAALNDVTLRNLPTPPQGVAQYRDGKIAGMGVRVTANGVKTFFLEYRHGGRKHRLHLGRYPSTSLQRAREKARAALVELDEGRNPAHREQHRSPDRAARRGRRADRRGSRAAR